MKNRLLAIIIGAAMVTAGCAGMPSGGPVTEAKTGASWVQPPVQSAFGPIKGSSAQRIVQDFLRACAAGPTDDYQVARQFLSDKAAAGWKPETQVRIVNADTAAGVKAENGTSVTFSGGQIGALNSSGTYTIAPSGSRAELQFTLEKVDGEWRIGSLADGVVLTEWTFTSAYSPSPVYFLAEDGATTVPDLRWFPRRRHLTHLVQALLSGPSKPLSAVVQNAFPPGARLPLKSVDIAEGLANVELRTDVAVADESVRVKMQRQLEATLIGVLGVTSVRLVLNGLPSEGTANPHREPEYNHQVALRDGQVVIRGSDDILEVSRENSQGAGTYRRPAIGFGAKPIVAVLTGTDSLAIIDTAGQPQQLFKGANLTAPSIDRFGWIWSADGDASGIIRAADVNGRIRIVKAPWTGRTVKAFRISRDGARAVMLYEEGGKVRTVVTAVERDTHGEPNQLRDPVEIEISGTNSLAKDVTWLDGATLAVLLETGTESKVAVVPVSGPITFSDAVPNAVTISGARSERSLVLSTDTGDIYERSGIVWRRIGNGLTDVSYPG